MKALLGRLYDPIVRLKRAEGTVEMTPLLKEGHLLIQLVNMNGSHSDTRTPSFDHIQPCRDIELSIALNRKPDAVIQRPDGQVLDFAWDGARAAFTVHKVDYHEIVDIEL